MRSESVAASQISGDYGTAIGEVAGTAVLDLPGEIIDALTAEHRTIHLLFEASGAGEGQLVVGVRQDAGTLLEPDAIKLDLRKVTDLYEQVQALPWGVATDAFDYPPDASDPDDWAPAPIAGPRFGPFTVPNQGYVPEFTPLPGETGQRLIWVHGWNVPNDRYEQQTRATFKRLWWQGYQGRFCALRWPSYIADGDTLERLLQNGVLGYNRIHFRAYMYASSVREYAASLNGSEVRIAGIAHSMGGCVTISEAVLQDGFMTPFVDIALMNGAISASSFDSSPVLFSNEYPQDVSGSPPRGPDLPPLGPRKRLEALPEVFVSYYNVADEAMDWWRLSEIGVPGKGARQGALTDSSPAYGTGYNFDPTTQLLEKYQPRAGTLSTLRRRVAFPFESLSYAAQSKTEPIGREPRAGGSIRQSFDIQQLFDYPGSRTEHSGQMDRNIQRGPLRMYNSVVEELDLDINQ